MERADFVVVGSSGGGGTIAWLLARAGFSVVLLEQGPDIAEHFEHQNLPYNPVTHDEQRFRLSKPTRHRHPRGDYNTFRKSEQDAAAPFSGAWTASVLGGGSIIWGTWSFRALPIDFRLGTHFAATGQLRKLEEWGYSVVDWPISYPELEPFYNVAETLLAVSGDRNAVNRSVVGSGWFDELSMHEHFRTAGNWEPTFPFPCAPYPRTPVGEFIFEGAQAAGLRPLPLPSGIVSPGSPSYSTRDALADSLNAWGDQPKNEFWQQDAKALWSERVRDACNMCGFCGEYLCWGSRGPKSSSRVSTLRELADAPHAEIVTNAKVIEVVVETGQRHADGVRYLDISDPDRPQTRTQKAANVIVSCGAVQSPRLLFMSGPSAGLGNATGQLGHHAMFHLFGYGASCTLPAKMQGYLASELGHTGNTTSFAHYFVKDETAGRDTSGQWWKAGTIASTAKKNPLDNADGIVARQGTIGTGLLTAMERYTRSLELRLTGDDLPMARNRVDLDPSFVDEYGIPVARITRDFGPAEQLMFELMRPKLKQVFQHWADVGLISNIDDEQQLKIAQTAIVDLIGDHQMGTCRMGDDPAASVVDRFCRLHEAPNVFVVDSSIFPTGFGLNPMVTVVANALRVGTWIVDESKHGTELSG